MKLHRQSQTVSSVGLEITPLAIRAVEIRAEGRETVVQRLAHVELPADCIRDRRVVAPASLAEALRRLWENGGFSTRRCVVALPAAGAPPPQLLPPPAPPAGAAQQRAR